MADAKAAKAGRYLSRMLKANPLEEAPAVLAMRRKALGIKSAAPETAVKREGTSERMRDAVREQVRKIQETFWEAPIEPLKNQLTAINIKDFPELRPTLTRLRTLAACRPQFAALTQEKYVDMPLFRAFKTAVVLPAAEAGPVRERFFQRIKDKNHLKAIKKMIRGIKKDHEILYQLERDWFESLMKMKAPKRVASAGPAEPEYVFDNDDEGGFSWVFWVIVVIIIRVVVAVMRSS